MRKLNIIFFDKLIIYIVFAIWLISDQGNKLIIYSPLIILFIYFLCNKFIGRKNEDYYNKIYKYFPFSLLIVWLYGAFVGLLYLNDNVFINNIGILFFITYYFISDNNLSVNQLKSIIFNLSLLSSLLYLYNLSTDIYSQISITNLGIRIGGYSVTGIFSGTLIPLFLYNIFITSSKRIIIKNILVNFVLLILVIFVSVILVASKGVYLSIIVTFYIIFYYRLRHYNYSYMMIISIAFFLSIIIYLYDINFKYFVIFSDSDESNLARYNMLDAIWNELSILGYGWGAKFQSIVLSSRDSTGYSSELSYMNLIHKIGIFSSIFFLFYAWLFTIIIKLIKINKNDAIGTALISLGMVTYLFTSIGNPSLFSPIFVFMTILVLHLTNKQFISLRNEK